MTPEQIKKTLRLHSMWVRGEGGGERANLTDAYLERANLAGANLERANLAHAYLARANLTDANLAGANLAGANLVHAYLAHAYLARAYLAGANLERANLAGANLERANLTDANLTDANLAGANLTGATYNNKTIWPTFQICPESGSFIGYKKLQQKRIAKLQIPAKAKRVSTPIGRKCRAEFVKVLEIIDLDGNKWTAGRSLHNGALYNVGQIFKPDSFDPNFLEECTNGVHFFITRKEAEQY
jgi:hypothetical protein